VYGLKKLYRPEYFQGNRLARKSADYFEGWYFKTVFDSCSYAFIPGVSLAEGDGHSFIQVNGGAGGRSSYHRFAREEFKWRKDRFLISVGPNRFSLDEIRLELPGLSVDLRMNGLIRWPSSLLSPSSMGWYSFARIMECYHGIVVLDGRVHGSVNGVAQEGRFYLEKDWGRSFPRGWIWMQSNSFPAPASEDPPTSLTCSIARVPFRGRVFTGFIIGLLHNGRIERFATYNGAVIERLKVEAEHVEISVRRKKRRLHVRAKRVSGAVLASPVEGVMEGRIREAMESELYVEFEENGRIAFSATGRNAGLEIVRPEVLDNLEP